METLVYKSSRGTHRNRGQRVARIGRGEIRDRHIRESAPGFRKRSGLRLLRELATEVQKLLAA
jgi:hypothetical protein